MEAPVVLALDDGERGFNSRDIDPTVREFRSNRVFGFDVLASGFELVELSTVSLG